MKTLLVLALVMGIVAVSPAAMQISVEGDLGPVDSEIIISTSDPLILDIHGDAEAGETVYWLMVVDSAAGTVSGGEAVAGLLSFIFPYYYTDIFLGYAGLSGSAISGAVTDDLAALSGLLVDNILYQGNEEYFGDLFVELYSSSDTLEWQQEDFVIFHQFIEIPEPVTIALLGFGGLLLSRRRKGN